MDPRVTRSKINCACQPVPPGKDAKAPRQSRLVSFSSSLFLSTYHCEPCHDPCLTCTNLTSCLTCRQSLLLLNGQCLATCPRGYYQNAKQCLSCDRLCGSCTGPSENDCTSCTDGFVFNTATNKCTNTCPNGNYYNKAEDVSRWTRCPMVLD